MKSIKKLIEDYGNATVDYDGVLASKDEEFSKILKGCAPYLYIDVATSVAFEGIEHSYNQVQSCFLKEFKE